VWIEADNVIDAFIEVIVAESGIFGERGKFNKEKIGRYSKRVVGSDYAL